MKFLSLIVAALAFSLAACERHTWEDKDKNEDGVIDDNEKGTKRLYQAHHGEGGNDNHGDKDEVHGDDQDGKQEGDGGNGDDDAAHPEEEESDKDSDGDAGSSEEEGN